MIQVKTEVWIGILLPFLGTSLGAAMVFVMRDKISDSVQRILTGFAAGVRRTTKLIFAVTLHNIPEGMAVGVVYAGWVSGEAGVSISAGLCSGSYALCGGRGAYTRDVIRQAFQCRHSGICPRICADDGARCSARIVMNI